MLFTYNEQVVHKTNKMLKENGISFLWETTTSVKGIPIPLKRVCWVGLSWCDNIIYHIKYLHKANIDKKNSWNNCQMETTTRQYELDTNSINLLIHECRTQKIWLAVKQVISINFCLFVPQNIRVAYLNIMNSKKFKISMYLLKGYNTESDDVLGYIEH